MEFYLTVVLLLGVTVTTIVGLPDGAPIAACSTITPSHPGGNNVTATDPVPYGVDIGYLADGYIPGQYYTIVLYNTTADVVFRGFLVQGRIIAGNTATGKFIVNGTDQQLVCTGNTSATHVNNNTKTMVQLLWKAPSMGTGPILFRYAFVQTRNVYWANLATDTIIEVNGTTSMPTPTATATDGTMTSSSATMGTTVTSTPAATPGGGGGATGVMAASSVMLMLLASIITLIN